MDKDISTNSSISYNGVFKAMQEILPGYMQRISYSSNRLGLQPFLSISASDESKTLIGVLGLSYKFDDVIIGFETESGKFDIQTVLFNESAPEDKYKDTCEYIGARLKAGKTLGGFISYKHVSAPNIDMVVDDSSGEIADIYYDKDFTSDVVTAGVYGRLGDVEGFRLDFDLGLGVTIGTPGKDVTDNVKADWGIKAEQSTDMAFDIRVDASYRQRFFHNGLWFAGFRANGFGNVNQLGFTQGKGSNPPGGISPEFRASRMDLVYGPYIGLGLVF
jgi:hypothetical protein